MGGTCSMMGKMGNACNILVWKPECKISLWRPSRRWEYNIIMDLMETGWESVDSTHLLQDRDSGGSLWTLQWTFGFIKGRDFFMGQIKPNNTSNKVERFSHLGSEMWLDGITYEEITMRTRRGREYYQTFRNIILKETISEKVTNTLYKAACCFLS
jgi:hypothetical protein